jgi:nucleoside-diphosphate-sugar epimerase
VLDDVAAGRARRIIRPGHAFGRIHRDDIARAVLAAILQDPPAGVRIFNLTDDEPAESAEVIAEAARLLGAPLPPAVPFDEAVATMSPMARGFWAESRRVACARTKATLGLDWLYGTYREGLAAILAEQRGERPA